MVGRLLILFAHPVEAQPTLTTLYAESLSHNTYCFEQGLIVVTGLGSIAAAVAVARHASQVDEIWNFGVAGTLRDQAVGSVVTVQSVAKYLPLPSWLPGRSRQLAERAVPPIELENSGLSLVSTDYGVGNRALRAALAQQYDLVDMEGYGIAYAAQQLDKHCQLCKIISDAAGEEASDAIHQQLPQLAEQLAIEVARRLMLVESVNPTLPESQDSSRAARPLSLVP